MSPPPIPAGRGRPGRPKDAAKHAAIVAAAKALFAQQSFDNVTMESVASQAGVSKMTVYSHFTDKETLFERVVSSVADEMLAGVPEPTGTDDTLQDRLTAIGRSFLTVILAPDAVAMMHALPVTLRGNPGLARRFYEAGPGRVAAALSILLSAAMADGELAVDDADLAAQDLICLWEGGRRIELAFQVGEPATPDEIVWRARRGTALFLSAYRTAVAR